MQLLAQHAKKIMEECKERAASAGLVFDKETLEYIVTNRDMIELSPKNMIPTLYDYWVHDVDVLRGKGNYELYPSNPYETVINSRPAISYYNDNNTDWMNVVIFYHVLAHIDFFQNNVMFANTWHDDFVGKALSDKRLINKLRSEHGRWVDYVIEFARGIDNLVAYYGELAESYLPAKIRTSSMLDFYFDVFLQSVKKVPHNKYLEEIERYNNTAGSGRAREELYFAEVRLRYPEFEALFEKHLEQKQPPPPDLLQFLIERSPFLKKEENSWMKLVLHVVRDTALYYQPLMRTKIFNEGWASYWHEKLFLADDRIRSHEADFAKLHAGVTALPRVGLNPYATGMRLLQYIEEQADKGRLGYEFETLRDAHQRKKYDRKVGGGLQYLFKLREEFCDFTLINTFMDQDFVDRYKLFLVGRRLNEAKRVWEYYVKSKKVEDYRKMIMGQLYHPPVIDVNETDKGTLELVHRFEGKQLVPEFIENTMLGIEYLWGGSVSLETTELIPEKADEGEELQVAERRVVYTIKNRKVSKKAK